VHPRHRIEADGSVIYSWARRARGHWRWDDSVEVPLIEEREAYVVGYGPVDAPAMVWERGVPWLQITPGEREALPTISGPTQLWVRQIGTFSQSPPLLLASFT
jgi:hypothetical protein